MFKQLVYVTAFLLAFVSASLPTIARAESIVEWYLTGAAGDELSFGAASSVAHVAGMDLTRGIGLTAKTGANSINASDWTAEPTDYFSFGFLVDPGYQADLTSFVVGTRSSGTGPGSLGLFYNGDGFANVLHTFDQTPGNNNVYSVIDLSALPNLQGSIEFRITQIGTDSANGGTTGSTGTFRIFNDGDGANVRFSGSVTAAAVPEPGTYALMLAGLGLLVFAARRGNISV